MGAVYKSICFEADTFLLLATKLVEKEINLKLEIEKLMDNGYVHIAKARYIMGSTCVTKMQLPTENSNPIKPLVTVVRREEKDGLNFHINRETRLKNNELNGEVSEDDVAYPECDKESICTSKSSTSSLGRSEAAFRHVLQNNPKSLKKSKKAFLVEDDLYQEYNDELLDEMSNSESKESLFSVTDPIRLFGILVPNALKEAQHVFNKIVNLLGECATVQSQLRTTLDKLSHLGKVKSLIEAASKEMKINVLVPKIYWTPPASASVSCHSTETEEEHSSAPFEVGSVSVQKSVRSVFYDVKDIEAQEAQEFSLWGSGHSIQHETSQN